MTTGTMTEKATATDKKRKRLTLEEQIARQEELLAKDRESLAKKQQRLRSLNASKMNKDRKEAQKKRNSMLIQLGLWYIDQINAIQQEDGFEFIDVKEETIYMSIKEVDEIISNREKKFNEIYSSNTNTKEAKQEKKYIYDKKVLLEALKIIEENCRIYGIAKI